MLLKSRFTHFFVCLLLFVQCTGTDESFDPNLKYLLLNQHHETLWVEQTAALNPYRIRLRNDLEKGFMVDAQTCQWIKEGTFQYRGFDSTATLTEHTSTTLELTILSSNEVADLTLNYRMEIRDNRMEFALESSLPQVVASFEGVMLLSSATSKYTCPLPD